MKERGSFKNRFRIWQWNLKRQQRKEEEEQLEQQKENEKIKHYRKTEIVLRTIFGLFLGLLENILVPKKKEPEKLVVKQASPSQVVQQLDHQVKEIQETILHSQKKIQASRELPPIKEEVVKIPMFQEKLTKIAQTTQQLETKKVTLSRKERKLVTNLKKQTAEVQKKIPALEQVVDQQVEKIVLAAPTLKKEAILSKTEIALAPPILKKALEKVSKVDQTLEKSAIQIKPNIEKKMGVGEAAVITPVKPTMKYKKKVVAGNSYSDAIYHYIKEENKHLTNCRQELDKIVRELGTHSMERDLMRISLIESDLIKARLTHRSFWEKEEVGSLKKEKVFQKLDENKLLSDRKAIDQLLEQCEKTRKIVKQQHQKQIKVKQVQQKLSVDQEKLDQFKSVKQLMDNDIQKQRRLLSKMQKKVERLPKHRQKQGRFYGLRQMAKYTAGLALGIFSFQAFPSRILGLLTGAVFTSNSIRGMRNTFRKKEEQLSYLEFQDLFTSFESDIKMINKTVEIYDRSLTDLQKLRDEFIQEYGLLNIAEVEDMLEELYQTEQNLLMRQQEMQTIQSELMQVNEYGKKKVKKLEERR